MPIRAACNGFKGQNDIRNMSCYKKSDISNGESITDWQSLGVLATSETENIAERNRLGQQESQIYSWDQALTQLIQELLVRLPRLPKVQASCIWLLQHENQPNQTMLLITGSSSKLRAGMTFVLDDNIADHVWQQRRLVIDDTQAEGQFRDFALRLADSGIRAFCAAPLTIGSRRVGVIGLASSDPEVFADFDFEFFEHDVLATKHSMQDRAPRPPLSATTEHRDEGGRYLETQVSPNDTFEGIIGRSSVIHNLRKEIKVVAPTGSTALILGETGTGKELIARAIHNLSPRRDCPFVKVNCAAIPAGLIESELFGHERGSFTGAVGRRIGRFEMAHGGTLFLDEIGDIPLELQPKLLRVLQEQEFERLGGTQTNRVDVRVVAATSRDLPRMVATNEFRGDLYYRLNVFPLRVPALRERKEDLALLVRHFVDLYACRMGKPVRDVPLSAMEVLSGYPWPGNIRELQNIIERAVIRSTGKVLRPPLDELLVHAPSSTESNVTTFQDAAREHILQALAATNWVLGGPRGASARLGLARSTLIGKMNRLGIKRGVAPKSESQSQSLSQMNF